MDRMVWLRAYLEVELVEEDLIRLMYNFLDIQWDILKGVNADKSHAGFLSLNHSMYKELMVSIVAEVISRTYFFQVRVRGSAT